MAGDHGGEYHLRRATMAEAAGDAANTPRVRAIHYELAALHRAAAEQVAVRAAPSRSGGS